jgi:hypothetical protein
LLSFTTVPSYQQVGGWEIMHDAVQSIASNLSVNLAFSVSRRIQRVNSGTPGSK